MTWRCDLAEWLGGVTWRSDLAEWLGGVAWRSGLAEWLGGVTWRSDLAETAWGDLGADFSWVAPSFAWHMCRTELDDSAALSCAGRVDPDRESFHGSIPCG